jgi:hypothetical protein
MERDLACWTQSTLGNLSRCKELPDLVVRCGWRTSLVVTKELPRWDRFQSKFSLHSCKVCESWALPQMALE